MEVISIERSTYEELLTSFNSFVLQMKAMAGRGTNKRLGEWLDNQDVCQILNISPRTLQTLRQNGTLAYSQIEHKTYYKPEDVERTKAKLSSSNSCVTTTFSSSSVKNSLSLQLGLIWNWAKGLRGILPL